jgi:hypothetical protein
MYRMCQSDVFLAMEVCYWALLFMPLVILLYLYSLQIKGDSQKKKKCGSDEVGRCVEKGVYGRMEL